MNFFVKYILNICHNYLKSKLLSILFVTLIKEMDKKKGYQLEERDGKKKKNILNGFS